MADQQNTPTALELCAGALACPVCGEPLALGGSTLSCPSGHGFDVARQGYVSLFGGGARANTGDAEPMVAAREAFLAAGHYAPIADAVRDALPVAASGLCVDLAGGTGYYLRTVLDGHPSLTGLVVELSKSALRRAARAHPRVAAIGADVWQPFPIRTGVASSVLSIFGPRNVPEITRVLAPGGLLVVVTPTERHLAELVGALGGMVRVDARKQERLEHGLRDFTRLSVREVEYRAPMSHDDLRNEVAMGPSAHHVDPAALAAWLGGEPHTVELTVSVTVATYGLTTEGAVA